MPLQIKNLHTTAEFLKLAFDYGDDPPLKRILLSTEAVGCETVILESNFVDEEYKKEYELFYKNVFKSKPPEECLRIHFFKTALKTLEAAELTSNKDNYLGYCTLRPLKNKKVCDAFINKKVISDDQSRFVFLVCEMKKTVELNGVKFDIIGFPYMQQDGRIAACAQTTIRLLSQYLDWKNGTTTSLTAPEVTEKLKSISSLPATGRPARHIPTKGLSVYQMTAIMDSLKYNPMVYDYSLIKKEDLEYMHPEQIIYRYLESNIPVIIGINTTIGGHAIVVIGHTFNPDYWWHYAAEGYYNIPQVNVAGNRYDCSSSWIQNFIVQDDNLGPYYFFDKAFLQSYVSCVLVTLPDKVYINGEEAELLGWETLNKRASLNIFNDALSYFTSTRNCNLEWFRMFMFFHGSGNLILRTYLRKSADLKKEIDKFTRTKIIQDNIVAIDMPEYVWIVEISWPDIFSYMRKKCGEMIIDATADAQSDQAILFLHLPGMFMRKIYAPREDWQIQCITEDDQPSRHLYRKEIPIPPGLPRGKRA